MKDRNGGVYLYRRILHPSLIVLMVNSCIRGILADVIVYIFAHLHTALLAEGNMLDIN